MGRKYKNIEKVDYIISMTDFIARYLYDDVNFSSVPMNMETYLSNNVKKLTHHILKDFKNPYIISVSFDYADDNPELAYEGYLLFVKDNKNNLGCYVNPLRLKQAASYYEIKKRLKGAKLTDLEQLKDYLGDYLELDKIDPILQILKDNHKLNRLKVVKETLDKENQFQEKGVFCLNNFY